MIKNKRGSAWVWIIIILIIVVVGIGIYFWLTSGSSIPQPPTLPGDSGSALANSGSSIPQPPALPSS